jgi:hypothetical protein
VPFRRRGAVGLHISSETCCIAVEIHEYGFGSRDPHTGFACGYVNHKGRIVVDTQTQLASLTDHEARQCLDRIVSAMNATNPDLQLTSPNELGDILKDIAVSHGNLPFTPRRDAELSDTPKAVRLVLLEFLEDPNLRARLEAALRSDRPTLIDPITGALVMAGIIVVLTTRFNLKYKRGKEGKPEIEASVGRDASSEGIIKKFFGLFSSSS